MGRPRNVSRLPKGKINANKCPDSNTKCPLEPDNHHLHLLSLDIEDIVYIYLTSEFWIVRVVKTHPSLESLSLNNGGTYSVNPFSVILLTYEWAGTNMLQVRKSFTKINGASKIEDNYKLLNRLLELLEITEALINMQIVNSKYGLTGPHLAF